MTEGSIAVQDIRALSARLTPEYLEEHGVLPLRIEGGTLHIGTWHDHVEPHVLFELEALLGARVRLRRMTEDEVRTGIRSLYGETSAQSLIDAVDDSGNALGVNDSPAIDDLRALASFPEIETLNLGLCGVGDEGMQWVGGLNRAVRRKIVRSSLTALQHFACWPV